MRLFCCLLIIISSLDFSLCEAQEKVLLLHKPGKKKRITYYLSDPIHLKLKDDVIISGPLSQIGDTSVIINEIDRIPLNRVISVVDFDKRMRHKKLSQQCYTLAAATLVFNSLHQLINEEQFPVDKPTVIMAGILTAGGLILSRFKLKQYRLNGKWDLDILSL